MSKVLVVGLDGATWDIIEPLAGAGRLPNIAQLMDDGAWGPLHSTIPPVTPAAWTSMFTGKNPGKHGIYDFQSLNRATYEFAALRTDQHREKTVWRLLSEAGKRSILFDVPFTYPPKPFKGLMLTGYGTPRTPGTTFTFPSDLKPILPPSLHAEIRVALPTHRFDRSRAFIEEWAEIMAGRRRLLQHLIGNEPWDLFMVVFSITDNMAHVFWTYVDPAHPNYYRPEGKPFREAFFKAYEQCDDLLGDLMATAGEDTFTLVLSDHGFGSVRPRQYVYKRLLEGGYIAPRQSGSANPFTEKLVKLAVNTYSRFPQLREWAKNLRPGRRELLKKSLRRAGAMPDATEIDYPKSKVILSDFGLQVWVNDDERFAHGIVSAGEREKILEELGAFLKADRDPITGEAIVKACHRGIDVYHGPFARRCPDLIVEYNNFFDRTASSDKRNPHVEGGHTAEGILIAAGQGIRPVSLEGSRLVDLAPTILHLLGQEVPPDMDGRVLLEAFTERYRNLHPVQEGTAPARLEEVSAGEDLTEEQDAELREQLRQLGYL